MRPSLSRALAGAVLLVVIAGALFFHGLGRYPLLDPDEARHAEVAREMAETAEHLRTQVEQQVERLESLARELVPTPTPPDADGSP